MALCQSKCHQQGVSNLPARFSKSSFAVSQDLEAFDYFSYVLGMEFVHELLLNQYDYGGKRWCFLLHHLADITLNDISKYGKMLITFHCRTELLKIYI